MPWWLSLLNSSLGIISAGFGVVAVIRPQTLAPSGCGEPGRRFYPAMYAARSVPLGLLVAVVVWLAPASSRPCLSLLPRRPLSSETSLSAWCTAYREWWCFLLLLPSSTWLVRPI